MIKAKSRMGGAVYILPNLVTSANLFCGYLSILKAIQGNFVWASALILLAAVFDILDGRVARMTGSTSEFGVQYDSLCDLVSFGLAPAILIFQFGLNDAGRVGSMACFMFAACGALRLARFNVQSAIGKASGDFTGLPIPMAAGVLASFVLAMSDVKTSPPEEWVFPVIHELLASENLHRGAGLLMAPLLGILMVSNVNFRSHKNINHKGVSPFKILTIGVVVLGCVAINPEIFSFVLFFSYALSGPIEALLGGKKAVHDDEIFANEYHEEGGSES